MPLDDTTLIRFWSKVNKDGPVPAHDPGLGPCWLWTAATNEWGYGEFWTGGPGRRAKLAHRVSYVIACGAIAAGLQVLHKCDTPACVRPEHFFLGTNADNVQDRVAKGRNAVLPCGDAHHARLRPECMARGERHPHAKLTEALVRTLRQRYAAGGCTYTQLASEFGLKKSLVADVVSRRSWQHVA